MKSLFSFLAIFLSLNFNSQAQGYDFNFTNTGANHTVMILESSSAELAEMDALSLGAFIDVGGEHICVGVSEVLEGVFAVALWGDDSNTPSQDGLNSGQDPIWVAQDADGGIHILEATFSGAPWNGWTLNGINLLANFAETDYQYGACIDAAAINYDAEASWDDGSCVYPIYGCKEYLAYNYNELANTEDGTCIYYGCTDSNADNFDVQANTDDDSCIYYGCMDVLYLEYDATANTDDGSCQTLIVYGCTNPIAPNFDAAANVDDNSCNIYGCTDSAACNFDDTAVEDDGSCELAGCADVNFVEYYQQGYLPGCDDGSCATAIQNLGITADNFISPYNSGSNMNVGFNVSELSFLAGAQLGAFYDINGDGIISFDSQNNSSEHHYSECVGLQTITEGFFSLGLWGDDSSTDEIDGLQTGELPIFALLTTDETVVVFDAVPDFVGFSTNGIAVINEVNFNITIYGCMDDTYCNFNPEAEEDDGSCEGIPGCLDPIYIQYDASFACMNQELCLQTWENAFELSQDSIVAIVNTLDVSQENLAQTSVDLTLTEDALAQAAANVINLNQDNTDLTDSLNLASSEIVLLTIDVAQGIQAYDSLLNATTLEMDFMYESIREYQMMNDSLTSPIFIDLLSGWNMIGYLHREPQDIAATMDPISDKIQILKDNHAEAYWPEYGYNGIGDFMPGEGYQVRMLEEELNYTLPLVGDQRLELIPTVPQWAIDMEVLVHPNDIRSLVRVVNMLGQEVNPEYVPRGTTLLYLFSDGTVEKKISQ